MPVVFALSMLLSMTAYLVSSIVFFRKIKAREETKETKTSGSHSIIATNLSPLYTKKDPQYSCIYEAEGMCIYDREKEEKEEEDVMENFDQGSPALVKSSKVLQFAPDEMTLGPVVKDRSTRRSHDEITMSNITIYLINMAKSHDRYKRFKDSIQKSDLRPVGFTRIEGVNGRAQNLKKLVSPQAYQNIIKSEKTNYRRYHYELTRGAVGCYLSHINVYKSVLQQDTEYAIIFEDDVRLIKPNILEEINKVLPTIPEDWDILLLGCVCFVCGKFVNYYDVNRYFLMHGYIVKKSSAEKILHMIENEPIEQQIDAKFSDLAERGLLKIYCLRNKLAVQWDMGTNIQIPVKNFKGVNPFDALTEIDSKDEEVKREKKKEEKKKEEQKKEDEEGEEDEEDNGEEGKDGEEDE